MLTEFDIHYRCESCVNGIAVPIVHRNRCFSKVHHSDMFVKVFPTDVTIFLAMLDIENEFRVLAEAGCESEDDDLFTLVEVHHVRA